MHESYPRPIVKRFLVEQSLFETSWDKESGKVLFRGKRIFDDSPEAPLHSRTSHVPEGRKLFFELTVSDWRQLVGRGKKER